MSKEIAIQQESAVVEEVERDTSRDGLDKYSLFVYGTLTEPECFKRMTGRYPKYEKYALLYGWRKKSLNILKASEDHIVVGKIVKVDAVDLYFLDAYESIRNRLYQRVLVNVKDHDEPVFVYRKYTEAEKEIFYKSKN